MPQRNPTFREFLHVVWEDWATLMSGALSVPFTLAAVYAESYGKYISGAAAVLFLGYAVFRIWANERREVVALEERLAPKLRLFLTNDPKTGRAGVEFTTGQAGNEQCYIQVCVEPSTSATIYEPVASITKIEHRTDKSAKFDEVYGEARSVPWPHHSIRATLSKGKPLRFNVAWYGAAEVFDTLDHVPNKLAAFYGSVRKHGQYRYTVHVEGRDAIPARAYVCVEWEEIDWTGYSGPYRGASPHPIVTLELLEST